MIIPTVEIKINFAGLKAMRSAIDEGLRSPASSSPVRRAMKRWAVRYRSFAQERFDLFSKGGGDWPPLKASTIARRRPPAKRKGKKKGKPKARRVAILRDLGILFAVLSPTFSAQPGSVEEHQPFRVKVGYGGPHRHGKGKATIADIASYHQTGAGHLPIRRIIVAPPAPVTGQMRDDMQAAINELAR